MQSLPAPLPGAVTIPILDMLTGVLKEAVENIPEDIKTMHPNALEDIANPTNILNMLRARLWSCYERAVMEGREAIQNVEIYHMLCTKQHFYMICRDAHKVAWLMVPKQKYEEVAAEALDFAIRRVRNEILTLPITEKTGPLILNAARMLDARVHGSPLQRIEEKSMRVNINQPSNKDVRERKDLEAELAEVRKKLSATPWALTAKQEDESFISKDEDGEAEIIEASGARVGAGDSDGGGAS